jgi:hypothetical protein
MDKTIIRPPAPYHIFWPAIRVRRFARLVTGDPKRRGTYNDNIRLLNTIYNLFMRSDNSDPRLFMQKVNPIPFARLIGLQPPDIKRFLAGSWSSLNHRLIYSKCEHCRKLAI